MTRVLANIKIMHKVLAVLLLLGAVTVALAVLDSSRIRMVDQNYSMLVDSKLPATIQLVRMNRFATEMVQIGYRTVAFPAGSSQSQSAGGEIDRKRDQALDALATAIQLDPALREKSQEMRGNVTANKRAIARNY